jgi:hypothetical protein
MKILLTPALLRFLIRRGFTHCFSKTDYDFDYGVSLVLTPVKSTGPILKYIPAKLDAFFAIQDELIRLLNNKQTIWVNMRLDMIKGPAGLLLNAYLISKNHEACINY